MRGDKEEGFYSYRVDNKKSTVLYSVSKEIIPNAIVSTCFKKHFNQIMNERWHKEESSTLSFFLPSITDRKEKITKFRDNISLNLINCSLEFLNSFLRDKTVGFQPHLLNLSKIEKRGPQAELVYNFFRQMAETSNVNLIRNANYLLVSSTETRHNIKIAWAGPTKQRYDETKLKLTY